jgi:hypothetical protein
MEQVRADARHFGPVGKLTPAGSGLCAQPAGCAGRCAQPVSRARHRPAPHRPARLAAPALHAPAAIATGIADIDRSPATCPGDRATIGRIDRRSGHRAQIAAANEEKLRHLGLLEGWKGEGQIGATQSSNATTVGLTAGLGLTGKLRWRFSLRALADYQRNNGQTSRNQMLFAFEPNYRSTRLFAYGLAQYERPTRSPRAPRFRGGLLSRGLAAEFHRGVRPAGAEARPGRQG